MGNNPETVILLKKPEVQKRLIELRNDNGTSNWEIIRDKFNKEFNSNVSLPTLKNTYNKLMATSITYSGPAKQHFDGLFDGMAERLENMILITDSMIGEYGAILEKIRNSEEINDLKKSELIMELVPKLDKLNTTVMKQLEFLSNQLEQVTVEQKKLVWDDTKLKEEMDRLMPLQLESLEDEGKIAIIDRSILN